MSKTHNFVKFRTIAFRKSVSSGEEYAVLVETEDSAEAFETYLNRFYAFKNERMEIHAMEETGIWYKLSL